MILHDPVFGKLKWMHQMGVWEGEAELPLDGTFLLAIGVPQAKAPPADYQREGFAKFKDSWTRVVQPQVARKVWNYWKQGPGADRANAINSPEALYRELGLVTVTILPSKDKLLLVEMRFEWELDLMGVVVRCVGTDVRRVTNFEDRDKSWMNSAARFPA